MGTTEKLAHARAVRAHTAAVRAGAGWVLPGREDIREVLVILSASRGGSSLLYEVLSHHPDVVSLHGEHVPHYKLHGFDLDAGEDGSDRFHRFHAADAAALGTTIANGVRESAGSRDPGLDPLFACDVADRLAVQWSSTPVDPSRLLEVVQDAVERCRKQSPDSTWQVARFLPLLHAALATAFPWHPFAPHYTDTGEPRPETRTLVGPPEARYCVEEPPFTMPGPHAVPDAETLRRRVLLLKASVDAYRLPLVTALFPRARIRVLHLTRNPAASVNGLIDGWLDQGFFSYNTHELATPVMLDIAGYSDRRPWGDRWWNFDAPPGWQRVADSPLAEVAAFQWASAHAAVLQGLSEQPQLESLRIRFEDIVGDPRARQRAMARIRRFAQLAEPPTGYAPEQPLPLVMATRPPRHGRWRERAEQVVPALRTGQTTEVAASLDYPLTQLEQWT